MSTRGPSQTGSLSQPPPLPTGRITRAGTKAAATGTADRKSLSPSIKKGRPLTAGEQTRKILSDKDLLQDDGVTTPIALYKMFQGILDRYNTSIPEDLQYTFRYKPLRHCYRIAPVTNSSPKKQSTQ